MTARELLDEYEQRARHVMANDLPDVTGCSEFFNLIEALRAVLDLHRKITPRICGHCQPKETDDAIAVTYPCPTVRAITEALGSSS